MTPRIAPIPFRDWPPELVGGVPAIEGSTSPASSPRREDTQKGKNTLGILAHHPALTEAWLQFTAHILRASTLTERHRELLILRVAVLLQAQYQWVEHVAVARRCGLDGEDVARVAYGPEAPHWEPLDRALLRSVDELIADGLISDETWSVLARHLDTPQLLDVIFTVGAYETNSWMGRSFGVELDDDEP